VSEVVNGSLVDLDLIEEIAARLDLRAPNREAVISIAAALAEHYQVDGRPPPFEGIVDLATGVGKTYILAGALEYLAATGGRNFAVITPGRTILDKTVANFTPGHRRSLLAGMLTRPVVITADNFATAAMRAAMDDETRVKLYVFTVQALVRPTSLVARRTHKFQEGLGEAFYDHLTGLADLVVFADEHHSYYGDAFSAAIRDLGPRALIGLTATPHRRTPPDQIVYRYPLAAAIADQLVKTPVLVGRRDDRADPLTKLGDGIQLLELKRAAVERYAPEFGQPPISPVMLVIAQTIEEAEEYGAILRDVEFMGGRYGGERTLVVTSASPDKALAALEAVEDPDSPVRVVIAVGMLKEGWDVKNVYVIASMRASVSSVLTEQTLGRGLRLPFGRYTGIEILDTLEVLAHERYEQLLRQASILNEAFIDHRTRAVLRRDAEGRILPAIETVPVDTRPRITPPGEAPVVENGVPVVGSLEERQAAARRAVRNLQLELLPRDDLAQLRVPRVRMQLLESHFSLADVTDLEPFRQLGRRFAQDPAREELRRTRLSAQLVEGLDGLRRTELVTAPAVDRVSSPATRLPLGEARARLVERVLAAPIVPARGGERHAAEPLIEAFLDGLGQEAQAVLSNYLDSAAGGLIQLIMSEHRRSAPRPRYDEVIDLQPLGGPRLGRAETNSDRTGAFRRGVGYLGWQKSMYAQVWFDSSPEREVANMLDAAPEVAFWVRLHLNDLPILWSGGGSWYHPDFVAGEQAGERWIVEVKQDREVRTSDVQKKREAARRWANRVNARAGAHERWAYLLASEAAVRDARGSWSSLKALAA